MSPRKYLLTPPEELHPYLPHHDSNTDLFNEDDRITTDIYPDFKPWRHDSEEDEILLNFVSKGYYVSSKVNFESISARSSLHTSLPKLSDHLSKQFSKILQIREQQINKIPATPLNPKLESYQSSNHVLPDKSTNKNGLFLINPLAGPHFQLPSRVTLTDNKKEKWLQDLSSPYASLSKTSEFIPHGLKKKQVLEQCYIKNIPIRRAIWLIKCCYSIEAQNLKIKHANLQQKYNNNNLSPFSNESGVENCKEHCILYKEWTDAFVFILERLIFEMNQVYNDSNKLKKWKLDISYFLKLLGNCYTLNLLGRQIFFHWLIEFIAKLENFEFLPLTLHILLIFWNDMTKYSNKMSDNIYDNSNSFLVSKIADSLLGKYYSISRSKSMIADEKYIVNDIKKNNKVKNSLLKIISQLICKLFQDQCLEIFLFQSSSWELYKPCLYEIINKLKNQGTKLDIQKKLELISYRNDMFKNNLLLNFNYLSTTNDQNKDISSNNTMSNNNHIDMLINKSSLSNSFPHLDLKNIFKPLTSQPHIRIINISNIDVEFLKQLDGIQADFDWPQYVEQNPLQVSQVLQLILWSIHPSRKSHYESNQLVTKILLLQINLLTEKIPEYEIEDIIWSLIFQIGKLSKYNIKKNINLFALYQLLNILNTYGMIKVPTYIRKLISSGIMYLHDSNDKFFHVSLLINLKISPLMKSQYNMVLRNVMEYEPYYYEKYNFDKLVKSVEAKIDTLLKHNKDPKVSLNDLPMSGKIMLGEWYLNYLCSKEVFESVDKHILTYNFKILCLDLKVTQLFYKWIEFIVYHQLLVDVETLETLVNILLNYQMIFAQFINDHILFTKTLIYLYCNVFKKKNPESYSLITLIPFWKFFMQNFTVVLAIDDDLRTELQNVYEEEKTKLEKLEKNKSYVNLLYAKLNLSQETNLENVILNYTKMFQTNIKLLVSTNSSLENNNNNIKHSESRRIARLNLLLLMNANARDYNKFMSIFLKRKNFDNQGLITLICEKLLTLDQVRRILGAEKLLELYALQYESPECYIFFETHKKEYLKTKFELILTSCLEHLPKYYCLFIQLISDFGSNPKMLVASSRILSKLLSSGVYKSEKIIKDLLSYGRENIFFYNENYISETESEEENSVIGLKENESTNISDRTSQQHKLNILDAYKGYNLLDFSNLWIFQGLTNYYIEQLKKETNTNFNKDIKSLIFGIFEYTDYNELCSNIFDTIEEVEIMKLIVNIMEEHFFKKFLEINIAGDIPPSKYLLIIIQLITSLFKKISHITSTQLELYRPLFAVLTQVFTKLCVLETQQLNKVENMINVIMKIFTIHQTSIYQYIVEDLQDKRLKDSTIKFIENIFQLFETTPLPLRLKLIIYDILSSLKAYCIYVSSTVVDPYTKAHNELNKTNSMSLIKSSSFLSSPFIRSPSPFNSDNNNGSIQLNNTPTYTSIKLKKNSSDTQLNRDSTYSLEATRFEIPQVLLNLPPFQVSSFTPKYNNSTQNKNDETKILDLGIKYIDPSDTSSIQGWNDNNNNQWYIYDKSKHVYVCQLQNEPYNNINNYRSPGETCSLNNSCFNLTLFDASLDNKNPN